MRPMSWNSAPTPNCVMYSGGILMSRAIIRDSMVTVSEWKYISSPPILSAIRCSASSGADRMDAAIWLTSCVACSTFSAGFENRSLLMSRMTMVVLTKAWPMRTAASRCSLMRSISARLAARCGSNSDAAGGGCGAAGCGADDTRRSLRSGS